MGHKGEIKSEKNEIYFKIFNTKYESFNVV